MTWAGSKSLNEKQRCKFYIPEGPNGPWDGPRTRVTRYGVITDRRGLYDGCYQYYSICEDNGQYHSCVEAKEIYGIDIPDLKLVVGGKK